jgi:hypothetical protein
VRIELMIDYDTDSAELRLFNDPESETATASAVIDPFVAQSDDPDFTLGCSPGSDWGSSVWFDDVVAFDDDWAGANDPMLGVTERPIVCTVRDYYGKIVKTETFDEWHPFVSLGSDWQPGWYRVHLTGSELDGGNGYGPSYGAGSFVVIKDDPHFTRMPAATVAGNAGGNEFNDFVMKGVMGVGTSRMLISNTAAPTTGTDTIAVAEASVPIADDYWVDNGIPDTERPSREKWLAFVGQSWDSMSAGGTSQGTTWGRIYPATGALDGAEIFLMASAGTQANTDKLEVYHPDSSTLVETFDNLANATEAESAVNASSQYIRFFLSNADRVAYFGPTAIGGTYRQGVYDVVSTLYPLGVTYYEGPMNEPGLHSETTHQMRLFQGNVHNGNANAKAIGPCPVSLATTFARNDWASMLDDGLKDWADELSFHNYNAFLNGNLNMGRYALEQLIAVNQAHGAGSKQMWQTESNSSFCNQNGIYHPRMSRVSINQTLAYEQFGIPRERNNFWYDVAHGFDVATWLENSDGSLNPYALLHRVLAEETWGKPFDHALDFGPVGNGMYLGSVYEGTSGKCVVLQAASYMTGASIVLSISGASGPFTVVDGLGRERVMPLSKGRLTLPMTDIPTYVRLPATASASVYKINGWSPLGNSASVSPEATTKTMDGDSYPVIADNGWMTDYVNNVGIAPTEAQGGWMNVPSTIEFAWDAPRNIDRVVIWCTPPFKWAGALTQFTVDTYDGADWTTRRTIDKGELPWIEFGSDTQNAGAFVETFWDEQWIFDVELPAPVTCEAVRVNVTGASYGGEPLPVVENGPDKRGEGNSVQCYRIEEIAVVDSNRYAGVSA